MTDPGLLDRLLDEQAIRRVLTLYAHAVDRRDWDLLRSLFHPDATDQHGPYVGGVDGLVDFLTAELGKVEVTTHALMNIVVEFADADTALTETYGLAFHRERRRDGRPVDLHFGVRYLDRVERRDGTWRIADRVVLMDWSRADDVVSGAGIAARFPVPDRRVTFSPARVQ
jgi:hypothetical protein